MTEVEILDVVRTELSPQFFWGGSIDSPVKGHLQNHYALLVNGWVLHRETEQLSIEAISDGQPIASWQANRERPDVANWFSQTVNPFCGFEGVLSTAILTPRFEVRIEAVGPNSRTLLGTIYGRRSALAIGQESGIQPALVTTLGRTGSTLLMLLLGQHPKLIVHPPFPFETRVATYWASAFEGLSSPGSYLQSLAAGDESSFWWTGHEEFPSETYVNQDPAAQWLGGRSIENLATFARHQVVGFYKASADFQAKAGTDPPRYFVEKQLPHQTLRGIKRELFPGLREIFLVRDFRDMLVSILAFNRKRGHQGFRRGLYEGDEYVADLGIAVEALLHGWRTSENALLIRYEDLVHQRRSTLHQILRFLELQATDAIVGEMIDKAETIEQAAQQQHRTSADSLSSIGRWRQELPADLRKSCNRTFAEALTAFGYGPA